MKHLLSIFLLIPIMAMSQQESELTSWSHSVVSDLPFQTPINNEFRQAEEELMAKKWTKDILSNYISPSRTICSVIASKSIGFGGYFSTIRFLKTNIEKEHNVETLKLSLPQTIKLNGITGMHVILGDNTFGQMKTEEKMYRSSQGMEDQLISQAIVLEGLNYSSLKKAVDGLKKEYSLNENNELLINYYECQHTITQQDLNGL